MLYNKQKRNRNKRANNKQDHKNPQKTQTNHTMAVNKVIRRMSDGEAIPAKLYEPGENGFLTAIFTDGKIFHSEVPNGRLLSGKIKMDAPPPCASIVKRILYYISTGSTFPPG